MKTRLVSTFLLLLFAGLSQVFAQLTFIVENLPANTPAQDPVYIAGNFNNWQAGEAPYKLNSDAGQHYLTLSLSAGELLFKFTRGDWTTVEANAQGQDIANRSYIYGGGFDTVRLNIAGWRDQGGTQTTAAANVQILSRDFFMPQLNRSRRIWVYLPPDYAQSQDRYPVIYMHDGQNLFDRYTSFSGEWEVDESLNALFQQNDPGAIVVGIDNGGANRINEYSPWQHPQYGGGQGDAYMRFIVETLKPHIDSVFRTQPDREHTAMLGSSLGALISLYGGMKYQDVFSKIGLFSPAFWFAEEAYDQVMQEGKKYPMRFYLIAGETESATMAPNMLAMTDSLGAAGFEASSIYTFVHVDGKHQEWYWRREFPDAYQWLFNGLSVGLSSPKKKVDFQLFPNPCTDSIEIRLSKLSRNHHCRIINLQGKVMYQQTVKGASVVSTNSWPAGIYFYQLYHKNKLVSTRTFTKI